MPDPIRAALRAAALATMTASEREHSETCNNGEPGPGHIRRAAETVAAFLRPLPLSGFRAPMGALGAQFFFEDWPALAAAVERAARDE